MDLITFKLIIFKIRVFLNLVPFCSFLSTCYPVALRGPISFLMKYRLICFVWFLSDARMIFLLLFFLNIDNGRIDIGRIDIGRVFKYEFCS